MGLRDDDRGQSVQVGAVLLFAVLVILLVTYQTTVIPNDNRTAEFEHSLETEEDMLDVRNAIIEAFQRGEAAPVSVTLGTTYPRHTFGVNPPPVAGSLSTEEAGTISVEEGDGSTVDACPVSNETKSLNYSADYNYYSPAPTLIYENTVLYADYGEDRDVVISDQSLVTGETITLIPMQGNYSGNGIGTVDYNPRAGQLKVTPAVEDPTISVPTQLSEQRWRTLLADQVVDPTTDVTVDESANILTVSLDGQYDVRCSAVGSNADPPGGARPSSGPGNEINPAGAGNVEYTVAIVDSSNQASSTVDVYFNNTGDSTRNVTEAKFNFYLGGNNKPDELTIAHDGTDRTPTPLQVAGRSETVEPKIQIDPGPPEERLRMTFNGQVRSDEDFFTITLYFENGETNVYFVAPTD